MSFEHKQRWIALGKWLVIGGRQVAGALLCGALLAWGAVSPLQAQHAERIERVAGIKGLVAFWDFSAIDSNEAWISRYDSAVVSRSFPVYLKQIGDARLYTRRDWPYSNPDSKVVVDPTGPFGHAIRFNRGYIFGEVPRSSFEGTPLNLSGDKPFTMIAWVKFTGPRQLVAGIWDEGGWDRYAGRRQAALFGGLFGQKGVIAHVSATGAASFPQSTIPGSQYARARAIDGRAFEDGQWVMMAMVYDPGHSQVIAMLNGRATPVDFADPVELDVYGSETKPAANPFEFKYPLYSPRNFLLEYNGYGYASDYVREHRLQVDFNGRTLRYDRDAKEARLAGAKFRITYDVLRNGASILNGPVTIPVRRGRTVRIPRDVRAQDGDVFRSTLARWKAGKWWQVGAPVERRILEGAPFTFGRALGLGSSEELSHGSELFVDGVAVFARVLSSAELRSIAFVGTELSSRANAAASRDLLNCGVTREP